MLLLYNSVTVNIVVVIKLSMNQSKKFTLEELNGTMGTVVDCLDGVVVQGIILLIHKI